MEFSSENIMLEKVNDYFVVSFGHNVKRNEVVELLQSLPESYQLKFYDQFFPSWSDPGAYVSIFCDLIQNSMVYQYSMGNHGWHVDNRVQSIELLSAWVLLSCNSIDPCSNDKYEITIEKRAKVIEKAPSI